MLNEVPVRLHAILILPPAAYSGKANGSTECRSPVTTQRLTFPEPVQTGFPLSLRDQCLAG